MSRSALMLSATDVAAHNTIHDCWIVVDGQVWDVTPFVHEHPGGVDVILQHAGKDATKAYSEVHDPSLLERTLPPTSRIGTIDPSSSSFSTAPVVDDNSSAPLPTHPITPHHNDPKPPLHSLLSSYDFENVASKTLNAKTWAFYSSAATDLITLRANKSFFDRIWFRPRVMRDVRHVETTCSIQGVRCSLPVFVAPAALAKMVHPSGELGIAVGCERNGVVYCVSTSASYPIETIIASAPTHPFFFQLYVNKNRSASETLLRQISSLSNNNVSTIFVTADAPSPGKREADERIRADETLRTPMGGMTAINDRRGGGLARIMGSFIDDRLNWDDLGWLRRHWKGKVVLKGIMGAEDAMRAAREGVDGIVLSNHGGRNLDTSPPSIIILLELQKRCPDIFNQLEVYIDGGIRRGTDILKALCLGATAVSMGRSFLYALNYGDEGVGHLIDILKTELQTAMQLVGITHLSQVHPGLVNTADIDHLVPATAEHPYAKWSPGLKGKGKGKGKEKARL